MPLAIREKLNPRARVLCGNSSQEVAASLIRPVFHRIGREPAPEIDPQPAKGAVAVEDDNFSAAGYHVSTVTHGLLIYPAGLAALVWNSADHASTAPG
jgi:hypothetical protein